MFSAILIAIGIYIGIFLGLVAVVILKELIIGGLSKLEDWIDDYHSWKRRKAIKNK